MKTIRQLSNRKLDLLQDILDAKLKRATTPKQRNAIFNKQWRVRNERLRRLGL